MKSPVDCCQNILPFHSGSVYIRLHESTPHLLDVDVRLLEQSGLQLVAHLRLLHFHFIVPWQEPNKNTPRINTEHTQHEHITA